MSDSVKTIHLQAKAYLDTLAGLPKTTYLDPSTLRRSAQRGVQLVWEEIGGVW